MANQRRNLAVDVFRGLAISLMVMVNNPGSYLYVYHPLRHSDWQGCTPADFVFPFFLIIVGISVTFSLAARARRPSKRSPLMREVCLRSVKLFCLGLFDENFPFLGDHQWRIPGVLQRIAIVYGLCVLLGHKLSGKSLALIVAALLLGYWGLLVLVPVPGIGAADLARPAANIAAWLDHRLMGPYLFSPDEGWDPEGLLSTIPALCLSLIGVLTGKMLMAPVDLEKKINRLFVGGLALAAAGYYWSEWFPFNRWLWTSSFMLFVAGVGLMVLGLCTVITEWPRVSKVIYPFKALGANAIVIYLCSSIFSKVLYILPVGEENMHDLIYNFLFGSWLSTPNASMVWAVAYTFVMFVVSHRLYVKGVVIKI